MVDNTFEGPSPKHPAIPQILPCFKFEAYTCASKTQIMGSNIVERRYYARRSAPSSNNTLAELSASTRNARQETLKALHEVILIPDDDEDGVEGHEAPTATAASNQKRDRDSKDDAQHQRHRHHNSSPPVQTGSANSIDWGNERYVQEAVPNLPSHPALDASWNDLEEIAVYSLTSIHKSSQRRHLVHESQPSSAQEFTGSPANAAVDSDDAYVGLLRRYTRLLRRLRRLARSVNLGSKPN